MNFKDLVKELATYENLVSQVALKGNFTKNRDTYEQQKDIEWLISDIDNWILSAELIEKHFARYSSYYNAALEEVKALLSTFANNAPDKEIQALLNLRIDELKELHDTFTYGLKSNILK